MTRLVSDSEAGVAQVDNMPDLHLSLLGGFTVRIGQQDIPKTAFPRRKALSLLKLLAFQPGHRLHRDQVLDHLWPDLTPESASAQLYKAVHHIRQAFASSVDSIPADDLVRLTSELVRLWPAGRVVTDVNEFEELARRALAERDRDLLMQAVSRYTGDLLPADLYEPWTQGTRDELRECIVDLLINLGESQAAAGSLAEASDALRSAVARDPAREDAHRDLMLIYARQGNRARAVQHYRRCVEALQEELGVDVSEATRSLYQQILDEQIAPVDLTGGAPRLELTQLPPLAGRRSELGVISNLMEGLARGSGGILAIEGDAGIGKTRLVQEILRQGWQRRWHVMYGTVHEQHGHQIAYLPFIEALRMAIWADPTGADLIPAELAASIPEIPSAANAVETTDRLAAQSALFAGVSRFLAARARTAPVILAIENLHAIDDGSLKLLHYIAREATSPAGITRPSLPLLLVVTWRPFEPAAIISLDEIVSSLRQQNQLHIMKLDPLPERDHRTVLEQALDGGNVDPRVSKALYSYTGGNALFAREMARQLAADGRMSRSGRIWRFGEEEMVGGLSTSLPIPSSLHALSRRKVESLSPAARHTVQLASAIGQDVPLDLLDACLSAGDAGGGSLVEILDELVSAGLLEEVGFDARFPHLLLREAVYERLSELRRRTLHDSIAGALESGAGIDPVSYSADVIAFHHRLAGNTGRAVDHLIRAGDDARDVYDHDGALNRYLDARELVETFSVTAATLRLIEIDERVGDVHQDIGDVTNSYAAYRRALTNLELSGSPDQHHRAFEVHRKITLGAILTADMEGATRYLEQTRELVGEDPTERTRMLIAESLYCWHAMQPERAIEHAREALTIAEAEDSTIEINQAYEMLSLANMVLGNWEEALRFEALQNSTNWSPGITVAIDAHLCMYQYKLHSEDSLSNAQRFIDSVAQQSRETGNQRCLAVCSFVLGHLALLQGQPVAAAEAINRALDLHRQIDSPAGVAYALATKAELLTAAELYENVPPMIEEGLEVSSRAAIHDHCLSQLYTVAIRNRLAAGDEAGATRIFESAVEHDAASRPCAVCQVDLYEAMAALHIEFGEPELATPLVSQAMMMAEQAMNNPGRARLLRLQAVVHYSRGEKAEAERCLMEAAAIFQEVGDQLDLARTYELMSALDGQHRLALRTQASDILSRYRTPETLARLHSS